MELSIDQFAEYVFLSHDPKYRIDLTVVKGLETPKDLFCFCLDLLCKGLVIMYGNGESRVLIEELTAEQFKSVNDRLGLLGIKCHLDVIPMESDVSYNDRLLRVAQIYSAPDNMPLEDYQIELVGNQATYKIKFSLFHNSGDRPCPRS